MEKSIIRLPNGQVEEFEWTQLKLHEEEAVDHLIKLFNLEHYKSDLKLYRIIRLTEIRKIIYQLLDHTNKDLLQQNWLFTLSTQDLNQQEIDRVAFDKFNKNLTEREREDLEKALQPNRKPKKIEEI